MIAESIRSQAIPLVFGPSLLLPCGGAVHHATFCVVDTGHNRFLLTAAHVVTEIGRGLSRPPLSKERPVTLSDFADSFSISTVIHPGRCSVNWKRDLASMPLDEYLATTIPKGAADIRMPGGTFTLPSENEDVFVVGFPRTGKTLYEGLATGADEKSSVIGVGRRTLFGTVRSVRFDEFTITLQDDAENPTDIRGMSGGPVFALRAEGLVAMPYLCGIVREEQGRPAENQLLMRCASLESVRRDGTLFGGTSVDAAIRMEDRERADENSRHASL